MQCERIGRKRIELGRKEEQTKKGKKRLESSLRNLPYNRFAVVFCSPFFEDCLADGAYCRVQRCNIIVVSSTYPAGVRIYERKNILQSSQRKQLGVRRYDILLYPYLLQDGGYTGRRFSGYQQAEEGVICSK
jgi:hypothetical protein